MNEQAFIIQGCKQNNRISQEKLYMHFYPALYTLCRRFFNDEQDIITALNNGMLKVFKNIECYEESQSALLTWIYTIVRNEALTVVRNKKTNISTQEMTSEISEEMIVNPFADSTTDQVFLMLEELPDVTKAVCSLFYIEGYSIKEISSSLDIKEGTAKWYLSDGRRRLQLIFKSNNIRIANAG